MLGVLQFLKRGQDPVVTQLDPAHTPMPDLRAEYRDCIEELLAHVGIERDHVEVVAQHVGHGADSMPIIAVYIRMKQWSAATPSLLLGLPMLEKSVRRMLQGNWVSDASHFGGVWLHASSALAIPTGVMHELKSAVSRVAAT